MIKVWDRAHPFERESGALYEICAKLTNICTAKTQTKLLIFNVWQVSSKILVKMELIV